MRVNEKHVNIDYQKTKDFFKHRAEKFQENNPYSVTMYQDNNKELVRERNEYETEKLLSLLSIDKESEILDVACGIGRWADAIKTEVKKYCGIDFSDELIRIATERNKRDNYYYYVGSTSQLEKIIKQKRKGKFNIVLIVGIMLYLNDNDVIEMLQQIERCCEKEAVICIREPIGIEERLTLKDYYSDELKCDYNAIYRYTLAKEITGRLRVTALSVLQNRFDVDVYSGDRSEQLNNVNYKGYADYYDRMPEVFTRSKINLNISLCTIQSGIPLRVIDIMACRGFVISNAQPELYEYFVPGQDIEIYEDIPDLVYKVKYYPEHEEQRKQIAENGYKKVCTEFNFEHRVKTMLEI